LILLHLDGQLSHDQCDQLADLLGNSQEARDRFWSEVQLHHAMADLCDQHWGEISLSTEAQDEADWITCYEQEIQQKAQARPEVSINKNTITPRQLVSLTGYLLGQTLTCKSAYKTYAIAASLLLAITLFFIYVDGEEEIAEPLAGQGAAQSAQPETPDVSAKAVVATLTAGRDAVWDRRPGQDLYAGQRFTLTRGFAEITTKRGAVAILQAPATIELFDNDNAIRLHTGKLVGICETESSKGFVVRTPHMDITDIGTRFGVDASEFTTETHVYQGAVEVAMPTSRGVTRQTLTRNQAVRNDNAGETLVAITPAFEKFDRSLSTYCLAGTGFKIEERTVDPNWQIVADANGPLDSPLPLYVQPSPERWPDHDLHFPAFGNDPARAQWLFFSSTPSPFYYPFRAPEDLDKRMLTLSGSMALPDAIDLKDKVLVLRVAHNNKLSELRINGNAIQGISTHKPEGDQFYQEIEVPIDQAGLTHGKNTIQVDLKSGNISRFYLACEIRPANPDAPNGETRP
jgi:hypothetical protein